ncbi:calcium/calmodulin-dependent protein kinase type IV-like [Lampris incognitus]|uniref:calcium/calmodulin-dependent protein kinase type IV-like n=1 Tax=Lampris incognitus TaxID=2546036 RepID=UPI0024B52555|nr:calcium/calmodulin-dependent protein kinase type IV-like [Lampris incognitus]
MPTSRSGAAPLDYWVEGSRRDATVEDLYQMGSELGRGATSVVFRCEEKQTQKPYAAKVLKKTIDKKIVRTEIGVLLRLSHPNIIRLKEIFETETDIALVLELVTGGELFDRIVERGYYSERDAAHVIKQILEAVAMYSRILNCDYEFVSPWWDEVSLNAKDLVSKLIVQDPHKRLSVLEALQHPWVLGKAARFSHMDTTQRKLQEFNARRKLKAAMKAVVATSRMHEGSRRRTDSCEMPGSGGSQQGSMQQDPPPEPVGHALRAKEAPTEAQQKESKPGEQCAPPFPSPPRSPKPQTFNIPTLGGSPGCPMPTRPPLKADGLRQVSVIPKSTVFQTRLPQKSCSSVEPASGAETAPVLATPPSPKSLSNGFPVEAGSKTAQCQ